ncbi:DUF1304 domain-containing protein [Rhodococcus gannanensis]|uniref:DUF1304 domain-containing protein n=1 Tax=Rhodococcus gannanensis TaxID=1960308 RepID=A0ABW4P9H2_9NOCA
MIAVAQVAAVIAAAVHLVVFVLEAFVFTRPSVHRGVFGVPTADVPAVRLWAFGVGFYNLFIGAGMIAGLALWWTGHETPGRTLVIYLAIFMFLSGIVLLVADRMALGRERGPGLWGSVGQAGPPLVTLVALAVA